jgi:hypothetical protein
MVNKNRNRAGTQCPVCELFAVTAMVQEGPEDELPVCRPGPR